MSARSTRSNRPIILLLGVVLTAAAWLALAPPGVAAGPGDLDGSFGFGGMVTTDLGGVDEARAVTTSGGRLLVAGVSDAGTGTFMFALARYTADGELDGSFGNGGIVTTAVGSADAVGNAITAQQDGKIVVAGYAGTPGSYDIVLIRYNTDGSLDGSFGSGGIVTTSIADGDDIARDVGVDPDGRLVVAGTSAGSNLLLLRYASNGTLDTSFGRGGIATTALTGLGGTFDLNVQDDGIAVATISSDLFRVVFYVDGRFSIGILRTLAAGFDRTNSVIPIGNSILMGIAGVAGGQFAVGVQRYDVPGTITVPYEEFGGSGMVVTDFGRESAAYGLLLLADQRIVAVGQAGFDFAVAVYLGVTSPTPAPSAQPTPPPSAQPTPPPVTAPPATPVASATPAPSAGPAPANTRFVGADTGNLSRIEIRTNATGTQVEGTISTMRDIPCTGQGGTLRLNQLIFRHDIRPDGSFAGITDVPAQPTGMITLTMDARIEGSTVRGTFSLRVSSSGCTTARLSFEARLLP